MIKLILAIDNDNLVGKTDSKFGLAWHYPEDMKYYKELTSNKINVMGSKTYHAIGRALPNRDTYILTRNKNLVVSDASLLHSVEEVLSLSKDNGVIVAGGVDIFRQVLKYADEIYVTKINASHEGDVYYKDFTTDGFILKSSKVSQDGILDFQVWSR